MHSQRTTFHFDGGWRPLTEQMETAVVVRGAAHVRTDLGPGCNETAEWLALLHAVDLALAQGCDDALFIGDNAGVVAQALGRQRCRTVRLQPLLARYRDAVAPIGRVHLKHVPRSKNLAGIVLARRHARAFDPRDVRHEA